MPTTRLVIFLVFYLVVSFGRTTLAEEALRLQKSLRQMDFLGGGSWGFYRSLGSLGSLGNTP